MRVTFTAVLLTVVSSATLSCGTKSKDEQAEDFYKSKLRPDEQKACNDKGFVFDFGKSGSEACTKIKLSKNTCDRAGLVKELGTLSNKDQVLKEVDGVTSQGYTYHQCGAGAIPASTDIPAGAADGVYLIFIKKTKNDDQAGLGSRTLAYEKISSATTLGLRKVGDSSRP